MKFRIFHPARGPRIQNLIAWCSMALGLFLMVVTHKNSSTFDFFFFLYMLLAAGVPILIMVAGWFTYEPLNGEIYDYLIFTEDEIRVQKDTIPKSEITHLKLFCCSYEGQIDIPVSDLNFAPVRTAGVDNYVVISTRDGHKQKIFFQVDSKQDLQSLKNYMDRHYFQQYRYDSSICID